MRELPFPDCAVMSVGVYIHIPFCETKCNYCHFVTRPMQNTTAELYRGAIIGELEAYSSATDCFVPADTVYFGGGTPSVVPAGHIDAILACCRRSFSVSPDSEISLEANPGSLTEAKVNAYHAAGINRVSLGAQSFDDEELASIGRDHNAEQIEDSVRLLRAGGIGNISLDLMLGLPGQNDVRWRTNLDRVAAMMPDHISVYMLDLHEKSPLYHLVAKGRHQLPDDDLVADLYLATLERLASLGYRQYEISNFALPGCQSRHNLKYWKRRPVLGFGVGSHSFFGNERYANYSSLSEYLRAIGERGSAVEWRRPVCAPEDLEETLFLGLRLNEGLDLDRLRSEFGDERVARFDATLRELTSRGLLDWADSVVRLTTTGMLLSNEIFREFV